MVFPKNRNIRAFFSLVARLGTVILRYSEGSCRCAEGRRSFGVPQDERPQTRHQTEKCSKCLRVQDLWIKLLRLGRCDCVSNVDSVVLLDTIRQMATYRAVIQQDGQWWIGWIEETPGV